MSGITRATAIALARRRNIEVIERRIMPEELSGFSECFITGTAAEVTAVSEIAEWNVHAEPHHPAIDERLHRRGAAEGQSRGGRAVGRGKKARAGLGAGGEVDIVSGDRNAVSCGP